MERTEWDYKVVWFEGYEPKGNDAVPVQIKLLLNSADGWELVSLQYLPQSWAYIATYKRPK